MNLYAHAQQTQYSQELFLHLLVKITSAIQEADLPTKTEFTLVTLSGMAVAVVQEAAAAGSTPHRGSANNFPSLPRMTLNSGCVPIRTL